MGSKSKRPVTPAPPGSAPIKIVWDTTDQPIQYADFFRIVFDDERAVLYLGFIDPEVRAGDREKPPKEIRMKPLARFALTPDGVKSLREHIEAAFQGMTERGAFDK